LPNPCPEATMHK